MFKLKSIKVFSNIKGYHAYKEKCSIGTKLNVEMELTNKYDKYAMIVKSQEGNIVGHVPARPVALQKVFYDWMDDYPRYTIEW